MLHNTREWVAEIVDIYLLTVASGSWKSKTKVLANLVSSWASLLGL